VWLRGYLTGAMCRFAYGPADAILLTVSCLSKIQIGFTFLVLVHSDNPGQTPEDCKIDVCVRACVHACMRACTFKLMYVLVIYHN